MGFIINKVAVLSRFQNAKTIDSLSDYQILKIFEQIDLRTLILSCKLVSKRWYNVIVKGVKFEEMILIKQMEFFDCNWHFSSKPIDLSKIFDCWEMNFLNLESFKKTFEHLKYFKINFRILDPDFELELLNAFVELEVLEIHYHLSLKRNMNLNLPRLRIAKLDIISLDDCELFIDAPIELLSCYYLQPVNVRNKSTIRQLEVKNLTNVEFFKPPDMSEYPNLIILQFTGFEIVEDINISKMPYLNEIHCIVKTSDDFRGFCTGLKASLKYILDQVAYLRRNDFKFYFNAIHLDGGQLIDQIDLFSNGLQMFKQEYSKLKSNFLNWFNELDWNLFIAIFRVIPQDFLTKFSVIQTIKAGAINNSEVFAIFIKKCSNLKELILNFPNLPPSFYTHLPTYARLLSQFYLIEKHTLNIDYSFLSEFELLFSFSTNQSMKMDCAVAALSQLRLLDTLKFKSYEYTILIKKVEKNRFFLKQGRLEFSSWTKLKLSKFNIDLNEVIEICKNIENRSFNF